MSMGINEIRLRIAALTSELESLRARVNIIDNTVESHNNTSNSYLTSQVLTVSKNITEVKNVIIYREISVLDPVGNTSGEEISHPIATPTLSRVNCDDAVGQYYDPLSEPPAKEAKKDIQDEETWRQRVLKKTINYLPCRGLERTLDENNASAVFELARKFRLQKEEILEIRSKHAGGGKQHEIFVEYIMHSDTDITIETLVKALQKLKKTKIADFLIKIKGKRENCSELEPAEYAKLYQHLVEYRNNSIILCWKDLAHKLGVGNVIANIATAKYSAAGGLFDNLNQRNTKISEFETKLNEIHNEKLLPVQKVIDELNTEIKKLIQIEKAKDEKMKKRKEKTCNIGP